MFDPALIMPEYLVRFEFIYSDVRDANACVSR